MLNHTKGTCDGTVIVVGSGLGYRSSNSTACISHSTKTLGKVINPIIASSTMNR